MDLIADNNPVCFICVVELCGPELIPGLMESIFAVDFNTDVPPVNECQADLESLLGFKYRTPVLFGDFFQGA